MERHGPDSRKDPSSTPSELADPTRRYLLDRLHERDGRTLTELESALEMTRFGVMKHLKVLEDAGLVATRRSGREKLHLLNPVPIITHVHQVFIRATAEQIWEAKTLLETGKPLAG